MPRLVLIGVAVAGLLVLEVTVAQACGDKLLAFNRGIWFQRAYSTARQASIIVYSSQYESGTTLNNPKLQATLRQVGHKLQVVQNSAELDQALKSGTVDIVLADVADVAAIAQHLQSTLSTAAILPVLYKPSKAAFAAAQKQYSFALKAPGDEVHYLSEIDEVMKSKGKTGAKT
jgi:hypothetical protein